MSVVVANGSGVVPTGTYPTSYAYLFDNDTNGGVSVTVPTAPTSNSRIDAIVAYVNMSVTASSTNPNNPNNMLVFADVPGTSASSPAAPTNSAIQTVIGAANPYIILAYVTVGTNVTQIVTSNISDQRTLAGPTRVGQGGLLKVNQPRTSNATTGSSGTNVSYNGFSGSYTFFARSGVTYQIHLVEPQITSSGGGNSNFNVVPLINGTQVGLLQLFMPAAGYSQPLDANAFWTATADGQVTLTLDFNSAGAATSFAMNASTTAPAWLVVVELP